MSLQAIAYPFFFLSRPEDRLLLDCLKQREIGSEKAQLMLYRIWADFATGSSDRREVSSNPILASDRHSRLLEISCDWLGAPGALVSDALAAGFLEIQDKDGKLWLVCKGFYPLNSGWSADGKQDKRKGSYARASKIQQKNAEHDAEEHLRLLQRSHGLDPQLSEARSKAALILLHRIVRAFGFARMDGSSATIRHLLAADAILADSSEAQIQQALMWMISKRRDPDMPKDVEAVLNAWADLALTARREMP